MKRVLFLSFLLCLVDFVHAGDRPARKKPGSKPKSAPSKSVAQSREEKALDSVKIRIRDAALKGMESNNELRRISRTPPNTTYVWFSEIAKDSKETYLLENGGVVKNDSTSYVGYLGYRAKCVVYGFGVWWHLWVNDNTYDCKLVKRPTDTPELALEDYVLDVRDSGRILQMIDGRLLEVIGGDTDRTSSWGGGDVLLFADGRVLLTEKGLVVRTIKR